MSRRTRATRATSTTSTALRATLFVSAFLSLAVVPAIFVPAAGCSSSAPMGTADDGGFAPVCVVEDGGSCGNEGTGAYQPVGDGTSVTQNVGPEGESFIFQDVTLAIPARALTTDVSVTITASPESPPSGVFNLSPVYTFSPSGLKFAVPATVSVTFEVGGPNPILVAASNGNASGYVALPTSVVAGVATATLDRLEAVFVADSTTLGSIPLAAGTSADAGVDSGSASISDAATDHD